MADKEYIEREAVKKFLHQDDFETPDERWRPESEFAQMVDAIPAADVVEVVRCEKCKYYGDEDKHVSGGSCKWHGSLVERTDFCSCGERKKR